MAPQRCSGGGEHHQYHQMQPNHRIAGRRTPTSELPACRDGWPRWGELSFGQVEPLGHTKLPLSLGDSRRPACLLLLLHHYWRRRRVVTGHRVPSKPKNACSYTLGKVLNVKEMTKMAIPDGGACRNE